MADTRPRLPQLDDRLFLTDGGIETTLIFLDGFTLPDFAAFLLLRTPEGTAALRRYFESYARIAQQHGAGLILETATWRASADWGKRQGYSDTELAVANRQAVMLLEEVRQKFPDSRSPLVISGCIGPRGDGYVPDTAMTAEQAEAYHSIQIRTFAQTPVDLVSAITMTTSAEALGVARAANRAGLPVVISFTVETDGRLPNGESLRDAVELVDTITAAAPAYYMINCAHPIHFQQVLSAKENWVSRIRGVRVNASCKSHAELNDSTELDIGNPDELGREVAALRSLLPKLNILGGCCGTDTRHIAAMAQAWTNP